MAYLLINRLEFVFISISITFIYFFVTLFSNHCTYTVIILIFSTSAQQSCAKHNNAKGFLSVHLSVTHWHYVEMSGQSTGLSLSYSPEMNVFMHKTRNS